MPAENDASRTTAGEMPQNLSPLRAINLGIAFLLELCMLAALAYWGVSTGGETLGKVVLGVGAPVVAAVVWGLFLAPRATITLGQPWRALLEAVVFLAAAVALYAARQGVLALVLLVAVALNQGVLYVTRR